MIRELYMNIKLSNHPLSKGQDKTCAKVEAAEQNRIVKHLVPKKWHEIDGAQWSTAVAAVVAKFRAGRWIRLSIVQSAAPG